jgi:drug/metabolite transporter (DMT)-like permease
MLNIDELGGALGALAIALVAGAIGGLVSELLFERGKSRRTGILIVPKFRSPRLDLGSGAAVIIGAAAGLAAVALLVPVTDVMVAEVKERQVDWIRILGIAIVAGAAGQAFWAALTKGLTATDFSARLETLMATLQANHDALPDSEKGGSAGTQLNGAIHAIQEALDNAP